MYREDYEEDLIQSQNEKTGYTDSYNDQQQQQQYQTPYYNYQEDYFNEEDEYKYLEEEREEAANQQQRQQLQGHDIHDMSGYGHQQQLDKLDELEEHEGLDDGLMNGSSSMSKHDHFQDLEDEDADVYHSDEDAAALDDNKLENDVTLNKQGKKRHLTTQESISDTEFFSQRFDGPGLKNLSKQESIIEEEEMTYPVAEPKTIPMRAPTTSTREVCVSAQTPYYYYIINSFATHSILSCRVSHF